MSQFSNGLPRPVRAQEAEDLAALHAEADPAQALNPAVRPAQPPHLDHTIAHHRHLAGGNSPPDQDRQAHRSACHAPRHWPAPRPGPARARRPQRPETPPGTSFRPDFMVTAPGRRERVAGSRRLLPVCGVLTGPGRFPEGLESEFNLPPQRGGWRALAEDCPGDQRAAAGHVDRLGQRRGVALPELALPDGRLGRAAGQPRRPRSKPPGWRVALRQGAQAFAPSSGAQATSPLASPAAAEVTRVSVISPAEAKVTCSVLKLRPSGGRPGRGLSRLPRA